MPSARQLSNAEKIHNLERRSAEQKQKYEMAEISEVMKRAPACIPHLLQKLSSIGMRLDDLPQDTSEKAIPKSLQKAAADRRRSSNASSPRAADHDSTDMAGHSESSEPVTPTKYHRIESCSVSFLAEHCCEVWEPGNLSVPNVKRMLTRGGLIPTSVYCRSSSSAGRGSLLTPPSTARTTHSRNSGRTVNPGTSLVGEDLPRYPYPRTGSDTACTN